MFNEKRVGVIYSVKMWGSGRWVKGQGVELGEDGVREVARHPIAEKGRRNLETGDAVTQVEELQRFDPGDVVVAPYPLDEFLADQTPSLVRHSFRPVRRHASEPVSGLAHLLLLQRLLPRLSPMRRVVQDMDAAARRTRETVTPNIPFAGVPQNRSRPVGP